MSEKLACSTVTALNFIEDEKGSGFFCDFTELTKEVVINHADSRHSLNTFDYYSGIFLSSEFLFCSFHIVERRKVDVVRFIDGSLDLGIVSGGDSCGCTTVESLGQMIKGRVSAKDVSGPVGIVQAVGNVVQESKADGIKYVILNILSFGIMLTANLGVMNLLPIPALDGGRLLFLIIEGIRRKPLPEKFENYVNVGGFMLLMGLMVVILANDILKIIH